MGKGKKKAPKKVMVVCENVLVDSVIKIKDVEVKITKVIKTKAKRGGWKYRLFGINVATGAEIKEVKPADRRFELIKGDASKMVVKKKAVAEKKEEEEEQDFTMAVSSSGAALTVPIRAGEVKKGTHVMLKGKPCKAIEISVSKTGKHGHAKANIVGLDVFTGRKYVEICPTSHNMTSPVLHRSEWMLTDTDGNGMTLMSQNGANREDLDLPRDTTGQLTELSNDLLKRFKSCPDGKAVFCVILKAMQTEQVVDIMVKEAV